ncbi:hypothetical protein RJ492_001645 [Pluralibacter gergoviae]|uniref:Uncharacterized protein n=1 Tax=Pluralibacter gergoviae TaxID=61647 RepID=A0AAI9DQ47_PLUGE|nr:hypothetical protein [Pluralibacter gergoviae]EKV0917529.1 hypothetical protein [Pluralibacter gergoviae]EKV9910496.1 hypothetical protein [Pluralibacter gergoviae]EKW7275234.1 hypothetical protein [Pluralibacter gergoviae]ELD4295914.1 hypothetical protein [Pluralibacter gergoviae]ELD4306215.1 hypothetical protein [Pluralibacter gergoviae]
MPSLPERLKPSKISRQKLKALADEATAILNEIDRGADENHPKLKAMIDEWNSQVINTCSFSDLRDFSSWIDAKNFTRNAFNRSQFIQDLSWHELVQIIDFICSAEGKESDQQYALDLLEINFDANPSDLIYWPNEWFKSEDMFNVDLTSEEIAGYLMAKSGRRLADAPVIALKYPMPA